MKRFLQSLAALTLVMSMQGCSNSSSIEPEIPDTPNQSVAQLRLTGNINAITPSTRVNADGFVANDKVGVYIAASNILTSSSNMLNNEAFTYSSGNLTAPEGKEVYWGSKDTRLSVWAYYPYVEEMPNHEAYPFAVHANQTGEKNFYNSDFITAKAMDLAPQTTPVNLTFNHSLSRINIILIAGEGITNDELAAIEKYLYINGVIVDGTIDLSSGAATVGTSESSILPYAIDGRNYSAIVYPQQGSATFRLEMNGEVFTYTTDIDYAAAKQYDYVLTINGYAPLQMSLENMTISPWGNGGEEHAGTMQNIISFSNVDFKNYLLQETLHIAERDSEGLWNFSSTDIRIDTNNDGEISIAEAEQVLYINVNDLGINSLNELYHFPNLRVLECDNHHSIDKTKEIDVSKNPLLEYLWCANNSLTEIDLSNNPLLVDFTCAGNDFISLDISKNTALQSLLCNYNDIAELITSNNTALKTIWCYGNNITSLDVSNNTQLEALLCHHNKIAYLDLSKNTKLTQLDCSAMDDKDGNNLLETIYLSEGQNITSFTKPDATMIEYK